LLHAKLWKLRLKWKLGRDWNENDLGKAFGCYK